MTIVRMAVALGLLASAAPINAADTHGAIVSSATDAEATNFLNLLKADKGSEAVDSLLSASPSWAKKTGARETTLGQIDAANQAYGPVVSYEKIATTNLGTMVTREYYLVQHRDMVVRWEFDLVRAGTGWHVGYFGFTDQPPSWF